VREARRQFLVGLNDFDGSRRQGVDLSVDRGDVPFNALADCGR
jgi:hypothetical protein